MCCCVLPIMCCAVVLCYVLLDVVMLGGSHNVLLWCCYGSILCVCCDVVLQNSLSLFGVAITSPSSWVFKITHIEEPVAPSIFHPHSSSWTAPPLHHNNKLRQCLFLGLVEIKVKAIPPSNKKVSDISGVVRLDLGFKQYISVPLVAETEGETVIKLSIIMCFIFAHLQW